MKIGIAYYVLLKFFRLVKLVKKMSIPKGNLNKPTDVLVNFMNQLNNFTNE